jgi:DNA replication ATP-dependent helicase Dna2
VDLRFQYRMNADIMLLSNRLIYNDRLECGSEEVARRCLKLSRREFLDRLHVGCDMKLCVRRKCWLERVADERYGFFCY